MIKFVRLCHFQFDSRVRRTEIPRTKNGTGGDEIEIVNIPRTKNGTGGDEIEIVNVFIQIRFDRPERGASLVHTFPAGPRHCRSRVSGAPTTGRRRPRAKFRVTVPATTHQALFDVITQFLSFELVQQFSIDGALELDVSPDFGDDRQRLWQRLRLC